MWYIDEKNVVIVINFNFEINSWFIPWNCKTAVLQQLWPNFTLVANKKEFEKSTYFRHLFLFHRTDFGIRFLNLKAYESLKESFGFGVLFRISSPCPMHIGI